MMTQTLAILLDAYRELNARKMFWTVLGLNVLVMALFALFGANDHALTFLWYEPFGSFFTGVQYKILYANLVEGVWFTWLATILALVSTAGIFPDLMSSGAIDLYLAKPIGRLRLFLTKYVSGLLFVTLQVTLFSILSFVVLGLRGGFWEPGLFLAIPLVVLFFSYLFAICVLLGVLTRSAIAALLLTMLIWVGIFGVDWAERNANMVIFRTTEMREIVGDQMEQLQRQIAQLKDSRDPEDQKASKTLQDRYDALAARRAREFTPQQLQTAQHVLFDIKSFIPKTRETLALMDRFLFQDQDLQQAARVPMMEAVDAGPGPGRGRRGPRMDMATGTLIQSQLDRQRSIPWIIGTSVLFELACLALAAWRFCTRDY